MKYILSFDFGLRKIGVAIGSIILCSKPLSAIKAINGVPNVYVIKKILNIWKPEIAIVGLPLNMDGTNQPLTFKAKKFSEYLKNFFKLKVKLHDERLTTIEARINLFRNGGFRSFKKNNIDSVAAAIILDSWLYNQKSYFNKV